MDILKNKRTSSYTLNTLLYLSVTCLAACNSGGGSTGTTSATSNSESTTSATTQVSTQDSPITKNDLYLMRIGSGYDSVSHTATSGQTCLANASNQDNVYIANPSAMLTFDHEQQMPALQSALNVDVSGQYGGDRFGVSVAAQFANASKNTAYTTNLVYLYKYSGKAVFKDGSLGQGLDALTPYAASLEQTSPSKFRTMCGDRFVEQMDAGALLGVRLALNFNSHTDQQRFATQIKADIGLANIATAIQQAATSSNVHVEMTLSAIQLGGQPEQLNQLFGTPDSYGNYPFLNCEAQGGKNGADSCNLMISSIISYAQTMGNQLTSTNGNIDLSKLYYTNPTVTDYTHLGIPMQGAPNPSPEILSAMAELTSKYDKTVYDYNFASHYLVTLGDKIDGPTKENLRDAAKRLGNQVTNVFLLPTYNVADCYKGYVSTQCLAIRDNVENALTNYQLHQVQADLITYLEDNSYNGYILNYYGGANPTPADYNFSDTTCIFAPVSNPILARYAVNCNGQWLDTANKSGVGIKPAFGGGGIDITDMAYISTPPNSNSNGQLIIYEDVTLPVDAYYVNYFYEEFIKIFAPEFSTENSSLGLTRLYENQA